MLLKTKFFSIIFSTLIIVFIMFFPEISTQGASRGIVISANVIIPSLFPFMVCVLIFLKSELYLKSYFLNGILNKLFGHNFEMFFAFVLSMVGGYPVGAKLISELYKDNRIDNKTANTMLLYCVNAGPGFVIMVVGGALYSYDIGKILLISHLLSSIVIALFCGRHLRKYKCSQKTIKKSFRPFSHIFTESVSDAASSILNICSFVIFFSVINSFIEYFLSDIPILKYIPYFTEITCAVTIEKNVFLISYLLGLGGISIWCQIFAITKSIKLDIKKFIFGRLVHGTLSVIFTKVLLAIFKIKFSAFSNNITFNKNIFYSDVFLFISMLIMLIVLLVFIYSKNNSGKLIKDVV